VSSASSSPGSAMSSRCGCSALRWGEERLDPGLVVGGGWAAEVLGDAGDHVKAALSGEVWLSVSNLATALRPFGITPVQAWRHQRNRTGHTLTHARRAAGDGTPLCYEHQLLSRSHAAPAKLGCGRVGVCARLRLAGPPDMGAVPVEAEGGAEMYAIVPRSVSSPSAHSPAC
jgi:hypothetical protein